MIYLGADHAGYNLKEKIKAYLDEIGEKYEDLGAKGLNPDDDYPDFALAVAKKTTEKNGVGLLVCGTGLGVCITANKVRGARAVLVDDLDSARQSKEHLNANVLCLSGKKNIEEVKPLIREWLNTKFSGEKRHKRRLDKINKMEDDF